MSLYIYTQPMENSLFDVFEDDFFNPLISRKTCGPLGSRRGCHRNYRNPFNTLEKQLNKIFDHKQIIDFYPKINLSEDENNFYIHADLPGMSKDKVNIEVNEDGILSISGERENIYENNNTNQDQTKEQENTENNENAMETEPTESNEQPEQEQEQKKEEEEEEKNDSDNQEKMDQENVKPERNGHKYSVKECSYGSFSRSFTLPENANRENIQAKMENGVLEIIINKIEPPKNQTRSIQIN